MSKVSYEVAGKHRRCVFANGAGELFMHGKSNESTEGASLRMARVNCLCMASNKKQK